MNSDSAIETIIVSRERDIGGFSVRRLLPYVSRRAVGPFVFFDHMGPAEFPPGQGIDVRPHPHINLATVTFLFEGVIQHRDSLGSNQAIEPGAVNWMTAGRGIVHSERTPAEARARGGRLNGIQLWVALPEEREEGAPSFVHHPKSNLPEFSVGDVKCKLLLGAAFGRSSPVAIDSDLFYLQARVPRGARFEFPVARDHESALYAVAGCVRVGDQQIDATSMAIGKTGRALEIEALEDAHLMLIGGRALGPRELFWNFVSSSRERLEAAKREWAPGPREASARFKPIPGDDREFIPLPIDGERPKGTAL